MDPAVQAYIDAIAAAHRGLFDRIHHLVIGEFPHAALAMSYQMPTYTVDGRRLHVGVWKHGVSLYGWDQGRDGGFVDRHPEMKAGKGTIRIRPAAAAAVTDEELRGLVRAALGGQ